MAEPVAEFAQLMARASAPTLQLVRAILEQDVADAAWSAQIGPALAQPDVARLLGKSEQAVSKDARLLRIRNRDGRPVYPVVQFDGHRQLPGIADVVATLGGVLQSLTIASWLTAGNAGLAGRRPVDALRDGDTAAVRVLARRLAADAA